MIPYNNIIYNNIQYINIDKYNYYNNINSNQHNSIYIFI